MRRPVLRVANWLGYGIVPLERYRIVPLDQPNPYPFTMKQFTVAAWLAGSPVLDLLTHSKAKDGQDLLAAALNEFKPGFFVDIGAYDGRTKSNTHLLEMRLGWSGLLVEPNPECHATLLSERSAPLETRAIDAVDGRKVTLDLKGELSHLRKESGGIAREDFRSNRPHEALVETATARSLFAENSVPEHINYVSIDVEGHELVVLNTLPFERHTIDFISVEHNFNRGRQCEIRTILADHDYVVIGESLSRNEDWFVRQSLAEHRPDVLRWRDTATTKP